MARLRVRGRVVPGARAVARRPTRRSRGGRARRLPRSHAAHRDPAAHRRAAGRPGTLRRATGVTIFTRSYGTAATAVLDLHRRPRRDAVSDASDAAARGAHSSTNVTRRRRRDARASSPCRWPLRGSGSLRELDVVGHLERCERARRPRPRTSSSVSSRAGRRTTHTALTCWPSMRWSTPNTAALRDAGMLDRGGSRSRRDTRSPHRG